MGCATWGQFDKGLDNLVGSPISAAIDRIGYPNTEQTIAGTKVYRWGRSSQGAIYTPTTSTTYGTVSTARGFGTYSATTNGGYMTPVNYNCNLTLVVDENEIIRRYQYEGNLGGCQAYIKALKTRS